MGRKPRGFTLIELLVVIAIIAILAAILFPVFIHAKATSQKTACQSNLHQIYTATTLYLDDWAGQMFANVSFRGVWGNGSPTYTRQGLRGWMEILYRYHKKVEIYRCPTFNANFCYSLNGMCESRRGPRRPRFTVTYFDAPGSGNPKAADGKGLINPSGVNDILSGDTNLQSGNADGSAGGQREGDNRRSGTYRSHAWMPTTTADINMFNDPQHDSCRFLLFPGPHNGATNVLFWDGHVRAYTAWVPDQMTMWFR